jgi:hypothetical protein
MQPTSDTPWIDARRFNENQRNFPAQELQRFAGQHIAWSQDGRRILASAPTMQALFEKLAEAGQPTNQVVLDYVDPL